MYQKVQRQEVTVKVLDAFCWSAKAALVNDFYNRTLFSGGKKLKIEGFQLRLLNHELFQVPPQTLVLQVLESSFLTLSSALRGYSPCFCVCLVNFPFV